MVDCGLAPLSGDRGAGLRPVFARADAGRLFENLGKVVQIVISDHLRDLPDGVICIAQQGLRFADAQLHDILHHRHAEMLFHEMGQIVVADIKMIRHRLQGDIFAVVRMKIGKDNGSAVRIAQCWGCGSGP